jgi:tetratricopeptide (TPR) repeat protein
MLAIKIWGRARVAFFLPVIVLLAGCIPPGPRALLEGKRLVEQGKYAPAMEELKTAVLLLATNAPAHDTAQAWNYLGLACHYAGRGEDAERAYEHALALDHDLTEAYYNLGCLWLEQNKVEGARTEFTTYTLRRPYSAEGFCKLGATQFLAGEAGSAQSRSRELAAAETSFKEALKLSAQNPEALNGLGLVLLYRGQPGEAVQCFAQALKSRPDCAPALLNEAIVSQRYLRDPQVALQKYREYLALRPTPTNAEAVLALVRQLEQGLNSSSRLSASNPAAPAGPLASNTRSSAANPSRTAPATRPERGTTPAPAPAGNPEEVRLSEEQPVRSAQDIPAGALARQGSAPASVTNTSLPSATIAGIRGGKRSLLQRINPLNLFSGSEKPPVRTTPAPAGGATAADNETESDSALPAPGSGARYPYRSLGIPAPGDRDAAQRESAQGLQAYKAHRFAEAVQAYRAATRLDPSFFDAYYNLGLAAAEAGNLHTALRAYESALAIQPDSADTRYNFALALRQANYIADAANELEKLLARNPDNARAHLALGNLYAQQLRQPAKARQHYLRVLELDPHNQQANAIRFWLADTRP